MEKPIYRMSGIGTCPRALSAIRLNYKQEEVPVWVETAAREGNRHEIWIKEDLKLEGYSVYDEQEEIYLETPSAKLVGHIDGKVCKLNEENSNKLLEVKSMSQYEFDRWMRGRFEEFTNYAAQITVYLAASELKEALYIVKNRSSGYIDKQIITAPLDFTTILDNIEIIEEYVAKGELVPAEYNPENIYCKRCGFSSLCIPEGKPTIIPTPALFDASADFRKGKILEEEAKVLLERAKNVFLSQSIASGQKKWKFNDLSITTVEVKAGISYKKENLLKIFTEEQLAPAAEIKTGYSFPLIKDLRKEE